MKRISKNHVFLLVNILSTMIMIASLIFDFDQLPHFALGMLFVSTLHFIFDSYNEEREANEE